MGIIGKLFGIGLNEASQATSILLQGVGSFAKDIREALTGELSPDKKAQLLQRAEELENQLLSGQIQTNITEASSTSMFVAGWRPMIGWVLGISIGFYYIPQFAMASYLWFKMCIQSNSLVPYPIQSIDGLTQLIFGMLGLAGIRTYEKVKGVQNIH